MPRALSIETSSRTGSIALSENGALLSHETFPQGLKHASELLPTIDRLTRAQSWTPQHLDHLYLSIGPGSFTGLRIAVTLAKSLSLSTNIKIVAVPSLRVLLENAPPDATNVLTLLDAKRDQIFTALYTRTSTGWTELHPPHLSSLPTMLATAPRPLHLLGEGLPYHEKFVPKDDPTLITTPPTLWQPQATAVAKLGAALAAQNHFTNPTTLTPLYIRLPEAEEKSAQSHPSPPPLPH